MEMLREKFYVWLFVGLMFGICLGIPFGNADYVYAAAGGDSIVEGTVWQVLDNDTATLLNESWNVSIGCNETTTYRLFVNGSGNISGDLEVGNITVWEDVSIGDRLDVGGDIHVVDDIFGDVVYVRSISIEDSLIHAGDSDTFFHFNPDDVYIRVGGVVVLRMSPTLSTFRTDVNFNGNYLWGANLSNYTSSDVYLDDGRFYVNGTGGGDSLWNDDGSTLFTHVSGRGVDVNGSIYGNDITLNQFILGLFGGAVDLSGDPWYLSGTNFQIAENLTVDNNIITSGNISMIGNRTISATYNLTVGNAGDDIIMCNHVYPNNTGLWSIGSSEYRFDDGWFSGKLTVDGGVDPPFVSFSNESHESIRQYSENVVDHEEVMQFWNGANHRMEVYVISEDVFYTLTGELVSE